MDTKGSTPYTNQQYRSMGPDKEIYIHIHNAPYILIREDNNNKQNIYTMHLYEINKSKHHSLRREDNRMIINESNDAWTYISTIKSKKWFEIKLILYSKKDHLLWFIYHQKEGCFPLMGYSIEHKQSLYRLYDFV